MRFTTRSSSNLDKRGVGDIWVMTVEEYIEASNWERFMYRCYRNPLVMFGLRTVVFGPHYGQDQPERCTKKRT